MRKLAFTSVEDVKYKQIVCLRHQHQPCDDNSKAKHSHHHSSCFDHPTTNDVIVVVVVVVVVVVGKFMVILR